jgi:hypothetical protein
MNKVTLGLTYKDRITGFKGICTGRCQYISGCDQALIQAEAKDGKLGEANWFDVQRLAPSGGKQVVLDNGETPGCDMAAPIR